MAVTIGKRKLIEAPWGLVAKVGIGALLSMINVATNLYTLLDFLTQGQIGYAYATIGMLASSILIQLVFVYGQNRKRGVRQITKEWLIVIFHLKPVVGAYRVVIGRKILDQQMVEPMLGKLTILSAVRMHFFRVSSFAYKLTPSSHLSNVAN